MNARPCRSGMLGVLMLGALLAPPGYAQQATAAAGTAQELGRLFFTPERRQQLDRQRQFNTVEKRQAPEDPTLTIDGVVTRSSGKRTVWINGVARNDGEASGALGRAKVGDTVSRDTGQTSDLLGGGRIDIRRAAPDAASK